MTAAGAAVLGAAPTISITHGHRWIAFVFIGIQVVLIVRAVMLLAEMKKAKAAEQDSVQ